MKTKRVAFVASACFLVLGAVVSFHDKFDAKPVLAAAPSHDVLVFVCYAPGDVSAVFHHDGSSGAPAVTATKCAQGIADARNEGFRITSVTEGSQPQTLIYTLQRGPD